VIAIVSSSAGERAAFSAVLEARGWSGCECRTVGEFARLLRRCLPAVVVVRHQLQDGHSDDVLTTWSAAAQGRDAKFIVILTADVPAREEARQVALGADCVQRDPIRMSVVAEYLAKFLRAGQRRPKAPINEQEHDTARLANARLCRSKHTLAVRDREVLLTPREFTLAELLAEARTTVSYDTLYAEVLGRPFTGDTANMRVLLSKLTRTVAPLGLDLRRHVEVIPKLGYRPVATGSKPRRKTL